MSRFIRSIFFLFAELVLTADTNSFLNFLPVFGPRIIINTLITLMELKKKICQRIFFEALKDNNTDSGLFSKLMLQKNPSLCLKCLVNIERKISRLKHIIKRKLCHFLCSTNLLNSYVHLSF